eukprot:Blabericola_migrator_1__3658@NODE_2097_length_3280_cov_145_455960_g1328_i0_p3_GENE_NODE_2097_length_3280_cov_145_455960_g1328_i0NODE_2097_length_3280_cov_145_455960_g1328_i0_p3_ORF_typecomplete_len230_score55_55_NODE_2097_length_3280_cov_145_455960_g1328_i0157846
MTVPYAWITEHPEQTVTIIKNRNLRSAEEVIQGIKDFNKHHFIYQKGDEATKSFDELFNDHEGKFYIGCRELEPGTFLLIENNGYYAAQGDNMSALTQPGPDDQHPVGASVFWNVNAHYCLIIAVEGKVLIEEDPIGMSPDDLWELIESADDFKSVWTWTTQPFKGEEFAEGDTLPMMFWLAQIVTGVELAPGIYKDPFSHVGVIQEEKKEVVATARKQLKIASPEETS